MSDFIGFLEIIGAVLASLGLAMSLEWLTLNTLLRLMPSGSHAKSRGARQDGFPAARPIHFPPR